MKLATRVKKRSALVIAMSMGVSSVVAAQPVQARTIDHTYTPQRPHTTGDSVTVEPQTTQGALAVEVANTDPADYGVGQGIQWPAQVAAPYVDMLSWVANEAYSNDGTPNLVKLAEDTGVKFYNLGFIQSTGGEIIGDRLAWSWGGQKPGFTENESSALYKGIKKSIRELREIGGDVTVSFGGSKETPLWAVTQDINLLTNTYMDIVQGYGLTRVDLSIVGESLMSTTEHQANAAAIKQVQDATGVDVVLTLPVLPNGLTAEAEAIVKVYLRAGVDVEIINLMTMNYGLSTLLPGENYATASVRAVNSVKEQVQEMYHSILGQNLSDRMAYGMLGTTPFIGDQNSAHHPEFTSEWMEVVVEHANDKELGMVSIWSMNRDAQITTNSGVANQYEFTNVLKQFPFNEVPVINGLEDITINQGDLFNVLEGVTATDHEDGDLTYAIKVTGKVNTNVAGTYEITYTVSDHQGQETKGVRTITVNGLPVIEGVENVTILQNSRFDALEGVTATDHEDGDLTQAIIVEGTVNVDVLGTYEITYTVVDSQGLETKVVRVVKVNALPIFEGISDRTISRNSQFNPFQGVTATDHEDGDLTPAIIVEGEVDTGTEGVYTLTYSVNDLDGFQATTQRAITVKEETIILPELPLMDSPFGVGHGIQWPAQVAAPFVDMAGWVTKPGYANNGAPNLARLAQDTGIKFYNLGFIQSVGGQIKDNKLVWGWGGYNVLAEEQNNEQYEGIKQSIRELREMGGDVAISLGGLTGTAFWEATQDVDILTNTYMELVEGYGLTRLDLDIEGAAQDKAKNQANAKAIKRVQDVTGVEIVLTLPVLPSGLTYWGLGVVEAYLEAGVDIEVVNLMTMCYGPATLLPGENYGTASLRAVDSTKDQLQDMYRTILGQELSDEAAYAMLGTTTSIGFEGTSHPIFTREWKDLVVEHANEKDLAMVSFWSINRDAQLEPNQGVNYQYEFTDAIKKFETTNTPDTDGPQNQAPVFRGTNNVTVTQGDAFNPLAGVTATDKEDGNLTEHIQVVGQVNTQLPGVYTLTYTVMDSQGLETKAVRIVTVKEFIVPGNEAPVISGVHNVTITEGERFNPFEGVMASDKEDGNLTNKIEIEGEVDVETPGIYTLTYTVTDSDGLATSVTRVVTVQEAFVPSNPEDTYDPNKIYTGGEKVIYNGKQYTAKWWTKGETPGETEVWDVEREFNPDGSQEYIVGAVYNEGDVVNYLGTMYTAKWWTKTIPGSDASWEEGIEKNEDGSQNYVEGRAYVGGDIVKYEGQLYQAKWWTKTTPGSDDAWNKL